MADIKVRFGSITVPVWSSYDIQLDMLEPADSFNISLGPASKDLYDLAVPDQQVDIMLDNVILIRGLIDEREWVENKSGSTIEVSGRDFGGRLVDESAPLENVRGLKIKSLAEKIIAPWFSSVSLSNAENRKLLRANKSLAKAGREPDILDAAPAPGIKIQPGQTRWQVLQSFLEEAHLLAWSAGDGSQLIIGLPNYNQQPQYHFFVPELRSSRMQQGNVKDIKIKDTLGERYSKIVVMGAGAGDDNNYAQRVTKHQGTAKNGTAADGTGSDFSNQKILYVPDDDVANSKQAKERAKFEMAIRDGGGHRVELLVAGHTQSIKGEDVPFAPDTMCSLQHEELGISGAYLITSVNFSNSKASGQETHLSLVKKDTVFA